MSKKKHQLSLVTYPAPNLKEPSAAVKFPLPPDFPRLIEEMVRICRKHNGIGLAAPQVGINVRLIIVNLEDQNLPAFPLINPEITNFSKEKGMHEEGCLSIPGKFAMVERSETVDVKAQNLRGEEITFKADGLLAQVIQHEVDHLNGILFTDHLSEEERDEILKDFKA